MLGLLSVVTRGVVGTGVGCVLLAWILWSGGPYLAFGTYRPLESVVARLVAIGLVFVVWAAVVIVKRLRARRASQQLATAIVGQAPQEGRPSAEAVRLRERFEEAVAALQREQGSRRGIYELPWYVFIGAPGSGKTTALVNSGLRFPLEQRGGALRGVGGTRNCDWWFTDEAVFLDTAGRYLTQDSDPDADAAGWREFLALLRQHRGRRPVNGIILTVSAHDLLVQSDAERETYVEAARRRLDEINRELRLQVPVYVMVTKCDLIAGFTEYFGDLTREGRAQIWGVTFPYERSLAGDAARLLPAEVDALVARLQERLLARVEDERDVGRRTRLFAFPQQVAGVRGALEQFVGEVFGSTRFERQVLLRGVYFTSGTQEGTPIDRLLSTFGQRFGGAPAPAAPQAGRGKAYFIERLLHDVLFAESGLAGVNRRAEIRLAAAQLGAYAAMAAIAVLGVIVLSTSYRSNRAYVAAVGAAVDALPPIADPAAPIETLLDRLDAVRAVDEAAGRHRGGAPWSMRWGLSQSGALGNAARDAYARELSALLLPHVAARFERRLAASAEPEIMYEYLKAYLMIGGQAPGQAVDAAFLADVERQDRAPDDRLAAHIERLIGDGIRVRPMPIDDGLVGAARDRIRRASIPRIAYRWLVRRYDQGALSIEEAAGFDAATVLRRGSGRPLAEQVPAIYTRDVFLQVTRSGDIIAGLAAEYAAEHWVWDGSGGSAARPPDVAGLTEEVVRIYEDEYIAYWDGIVGDVTVPSMSRQQIGDGLRILSGPLSPLRGFYQAVAEQTRIEAAADPQEPAQGGLGGALRSFTDQTVSSGAAVMPGRRITAHFEPIHALVDASGGSAPIDGVLGDLRLMSGVFDAVGDRIGGIDPTDPRTQGEVEAVVRRLGDRLLPDPLAAIVQQIGGMALSGASGGLRAALLDRYRREVVAPCTTLTEGGSRYPLSSNPDAGDMRIDDFAALFGPNGHFATFLRASLNDHVDQTRRPWRRRDGAAAIPDGILRQFEQADAIRRAFFGGGAEPAFGFRVIAADRGHDFESFELRTAASHMTYAHEAPRPFQQRWPDEPVRVSFRGSDGARTWEERGPWAWFRAMTEQGRLERIADDRYRLTLAAGPYATLLEVEMTSVSNPLAIWSQVRGFRCDAS